MMKKPQGYDQAEAMEVGTYRAIPSGWYPAVILMAAEGTTLNGSPYVEFSFDIAEGEYAGYYRKDFNGQAPRDGQKKWRGTVRYFTTEKSVGMFKGAIRAIEVSNPGYQFDWDEKTLKNKRVGVGIRREEYEGTDGKIKTVNRPYALCAVQRISEMPEPKDKTLDTGRTANGSGYPAPPPVQPLSGYQAQPEPAGGWEELGDSEDLPF